MNKTNRNKKRLPTRTDTRSGYKKTQLDWIPDDWETTNFGNVFIFLKIYSFSRSQLDSEKTEDEIHNIHYGDIHKTFENKVLDFEHEYEIPYIKNGLINIEELNSHNFPILKDGDLIIADASEDYDGLCDSIELKNINGRKIVGGLHTFATRASEKIVAFGFRAYILKHPQIIREIRRIATGISVFGISKTNLSKLNIVLPPLSEQKAIAKLLSTWDNAITKTTLLIEQKELRKKWLMQNLLTGKKRLPGFNDEWKAKKIKDVFEFVKSYSHSRANLTYDSNDGTILNIHYGDIHKVFKKDILDVEKEKRISLLKPEFEDDFQFLKDGDIIIADASEDYEGVGESIEIASVKNRKIISGLHTIVLRDKSDLTAPNFCGYLFNGEKILNKLRKSATGISVYGISKKNVGLLKIELPSKKEQTVIAKVLKTADEEIELLKIKLDRLKEQKKGLMQILLTGKHRLNYD